MKGLIKIMDDEKYKGYLTDLISLLKEQAREAKSDANKPEKGYEGYNQGHLMAYYSVISLLKHQAIVFNMDEKELGLADIDPDADLLGLHRRDK
jgi:hypothetical protein